MRIQETLIAAVFVAGAVAGSVAVCQSKPVDDEKGLSCGFLSRTRADNQNDPLTKASRFLDKGEPGEAAKIYMDYERAFVASNIGKELSKEQLEHIAIVRNNTGVAMFLQAQRLAEPEKNELLLKVANECFNASRNSMLDVNPESSLVSISLLNHSNVLRTHECEEKKKLLRMTESAKNRMNKKVGELFI